MKIKFWGVRGSLPLASGTEKGREHIGQVLHRFFDSGLKSKSDIEHFINKTSLVDLVGYGQNTTCVQVESQNQHLIVDAGSGIKTYNDYLATFDRERTSHHILMTHFHLDHIMGLTFFTPFFLNGHVVHIYAVQPELQRMIRMLFSQPLFPVPFESLSAKIVFHQLEVYKPTQIENFNVIPYKLDHPDDCYGFKISADGQVYSHAVDHESNRIEKSELGADAELFKNTNLVYFDAQYTESEMNEKKGWGHGTFQRAFKLCQNFQIPNIVLAHHDPSFGHCDMDRLVQNAEHYFLKNNSSLQIEKLNWQFAYDGLVLEI